MRLIAMDRDLGHDCEPHLAAMFCTAFGYSDSTAASAVSCNGLAAQDFFVRSASLALFGALCTRIFGADRLAGSRSSQLKVHAGSSTEDDSSSGGANSGGLTASEFFSRFPLLRQVIHHQLERPENMQFIGERGHSSNASVDPRALMATLVLLGRIAPSPIRAIRRQISDVADASIASEVALGASRSALAAALHPLHSIAPFSESGYDPLPWVLRSAVGGKGERVRRLAARAIKSLVQPPLTASAMVLAVVYTMPEDSGELKDNALALWLRSVNGNNGAHGLLYIANDLISQMYVLVFFLFL